MYFVQQAKGETMTDNIETDELNDTSSAAAVGCSVCGAPSTHAKRNTYRVTNEDGTYSSAPAGVFYWRCDAHNQDPLIEDIGYLRDEA